jgi:glutamate transport system permease protein
VSAQTVLFDAPGPRARRRHAVLTVLGVLMLLAGVVVVLRKMAAAEQLHGYMWTPFFQVEVWTEYLLPGLLDTVKAAALSIVLAGAFGLIFGMGRLSEHRLISWSSGIVVEFFRAVPVLIMMIFMFQVYAVNQVFESTLNPFAAVVTALTLYNGSVIAELVRSGVHNLAAGQGEAGLSIGLTRGQTLRAILLPQALTAMLPSLVSQMVVILKDSALGTVITYTELLSWSKTLGSAYANTLPAYIVAAVLFILMNYTLTRFASWVQQRTGRRVAASGTAVEEVAAGIPPAEPPQPVGTR